MRPVVTLYTRASCCLCDTALATIERVRESLAAKQYDDAAKQHDDNAMQHDNSAMQQAQPFALTVVDVDSDERLAALYGEEVPVVLVDGHKHAKLRLDEARFAERIARALREQASAPAVTAADGGERA